MIGNIESNFMNIKKKKTENGQIFYKRTLFGPIISVSLSKFLFLDLKIELRVKCSKEWL